MEVRFTVSSGGRMLSFVTRGHDFHQAFAQVGTELWKREISPDPGSRGVIEFHRPKPGQTICHELLDRIDEVQRRHKLAQPLGTERKMTINEVTWLARPIDPSVVEDEVCLEATATRPKTRVHTFTFTDGSSTQWNEVVE